MVDSDSRLDRIEEKIDRLSEAMVSIARAEEKLVAMEQKYSSQYERQNRQSEKMDDLERRVCDNTNTLLFMSKMFWLVAATVIGTLATVITQIMV